MWVNYSIRQVLKDVAEVSRLRVQVASLTHATVGAFLGARTPHDLLTLEFWAYVCLTFVLITYSCHVNSLWDLNVDLRYKRYIGEATLRLGDRFMKRLITADLIISALLMAVIGARGRWVTVILAILGAFLAWAYSAPPLRIKARGWVSFLPVMIGLYSFPVFGGWFLFQDTITPEILIFTLGYAFICQGITFVNTAEDYEEDRAEGIKTIAHVVGIRALLTAGAFMVIVGSGIASLYLFGRAKEVSSGPLGTFTPFLTLVAGIFIFLRMMRAVRAEDLIQESKKLGPLMGPWFLITRYPLFFSAFFQVVGV